MVRFRKLTLEEYQSYLSSPPLPRHGPRLKPFRTPKPSVQPIRYLYVIDITICPDLYQTWSVYAMRRLTRAQIAWCWAEDAAASRWLGTSGRERWERFLDFHSVRIAERLISAREPRPENSAPPQFPWFVDEHDEKLPVDQRYLS